MKQVIWLLVTVVILGIAVASALRADSNCDNSDPGGATIQFE